MSFTAKDVKGIPSSTSAALKGLAAGLLVGLEQELDAVGRLA
jgi:hypothetical protein